MGGFRGRERRSAAADGPERRGGVRQSAGRGEVRQELFPQRRAAVLRARQGVFPGAPELEVLCWALLGRRVQVHQQQDVARERRASRPSVQPAGQGTRASQPQRLAGAPERRALPRELQRVPQAWRALRRRSQGAREQRAPSRLLALQPVSSSPLLRQLPWQPFPWPQPPQQRLLDLQARGNVAGLFPPPRHQSSWNGSSSRRRQSRASSQSASWP